jgi:PAS domain S-box-containing protein
MKLILDMILKSRNFLMAVKPLRASLVFLLLVMGITPDCRADQNHRILVLHSYHKGFSWTDGITKGINKKISAASIPIDIEYAYMDTKRIFSPDYIDQLVKLYSVKFKHRTFDAIISSDDQAFEFLLHHHGRLFPNTPVIFCGVNHFHDDMLQGKPQFTGVLESFDTLDTINTALNLHPRAKRLVVISDQSAGGKANRKQFEKVIPQLDRPLSITILDHYSMAEMASYVSELSSEDILVCLPFTLDSDDKFSPHEDYTRILSAHSHAPMYSFSDVTIGHGIVGGKLASGMRQGEKAAELALRILRGESVEKLPIIRKSPNQYMFDHIQLKRFGLENAQLPPDSIIVNRPVSSYSQKKVLVWSAWVIFCCMTTIIVALLMAIASRKKTERALIASKDRYQSVFNSASVALFEADFSAVHKEIQSTTDTSGANLRNYLDDRPDALQLLTRMIEVKEVNAAAVQLFRAPDKSTLISALLKEILPPQSRAIKEILVCLADEREHLMWEDEIESLDGESLHVVLSLNIPRDKENYRSMVFSVFDLTDRKLSEQALRRSEDRFRTVFNQAASGMALIDLDGSFLRVNGALTQMLGYSERELLQRTWQEVTHTDDIDVSVRHIDQVLLGQMVYPIEKRVIHKNGNVVDVLFNLAAIYGKMKMPLYFAAQFEDITQIKAAQAALNERDERYRQIFEADLSGVYTTTSEGKLAMCNNVMAKILGFTHHKEAIGTNILDFYKDPAQRSLLKAQLASKKHVEHFEIELVRKDGSVVQCLVNAIGRFDAQGKLIEIQGYLMDVTRLKSLENQLLHAQKMESIGTMAGGVAHDFNNLLMGIMGNTSLMLLEKEKGDPDYHRLKSIEQLIESGSDLTRQLLGFAKGGKYEVRTSDLNKIIRRSIRIFARTHKQIQVSTDLSEELKWVEADRSQFDQVLYNLYLNAWQAMENGGRLDIRTRNRQLDQTTAEPYGLKPGEYAQVTVQDTGIGMDIKTQQRIFDPFFTTKERERGTGLGLASAYGIIKNHAGSITVQSSPDQGSCFSILLPVSTKAAVEEVSEPSPRLLGGTETILLVDDEHSVLDAVGNMLEYLGYKVLTASDANAAISMLEKDHGIIDLIILDMVMPGMGGKEAFKHFKEIDPAVKVLLCSGYTADGQTDCFIAEGCLGFIQKPFTINQLSQKINQAFQTT